MSLKDIIKLATTWRGKHNQVITIVYLQLVEQITIVNQLHFISPNILKNWIQIINYEKIYEIKQI